MDSNDVFERERSYNNFVHSLIFSILAGSSITISLERILITPSSNTIIFESIIAGIIGFIFFYIAIRVARKSESIRSEFVCSIRGDSIVAMCKTAIDFLKDDGEPKEKVSKVERVHSLFLDTSIYKNNRLDRLHQYYNDIKEIISGVGKNSKELLIGLENYLQNIMELGKNISEAILANSSVFEGELLENNGDGKIRGFTADKHQLLFEIEIESLMSNTLDSPAYVRFSIFQYNLRVYRDLNEKMRHIFSRISLDSKLRDFGLEFETQKDKSYWERFNREINSDLQNLMDRQDSGDEGEQ